MNIAQANVAPITNNQVFETITLKNIVALDLVQHNEALLKAFQLLDDSQIKVVLDGTLTVERLQQLIDERKSNTEDLKTYKNELQQAVDPNVALLSSLANEFQQDEIPLDDTDDLIAQYERENGVKITFDHEETNYKTAKAAIFDDRSS